MALFTSPREWVRNKVGANLPALVLRNPWRKKIGHERWKAEDGSRSEPVRAASPWEDPHQGNCSSGSSFSKAYSEGGSEPRRVRKLPRRVRNLPSLADRGGHRKEAHVSDSSEPDPEQCRISERPRRVVDPPPGEHVELGAQGSSSSEQPQQNRTQDARHAGPSADAVAMGVADGVTDGVTDGVADGGDDGVADGVADASDAVADVEASAPSCGPAAAAAPPLSTEAPRRSSVVNPLKQRSRRGSAAEGSRRGSAAEATPNESRRSSGSSFAPHSCRSSLTVAAAAPAEGPGCRPCQVHRRESVLSVDLKGEHRISLISTVSTGPPPQRDVLDRCGEEELDSCSSAGEWSGCGSGKSQYGAAEATLETRADGGPSPADSDDGSKCGESTATPILSPPDSPQRTRQRSNSFLRVPERRPSQAKLEVPAGLQQRRRPSLSRALTAPESPSKGAQSPSKGGGPSRFMSLPADTPDEPDEEAQAEAPPRCQAVRRPSAPATPSAQSFPRRLQAAKSSPEGWLGAQDGAGPRSARELRSMGSAELGDIDEAPLSEQFHDPLPDYKEVPTETGGRKSPPPRQPAAAQDADGFYEKLHMKLEREALLRQRSEPEPQAAFSDDEAAGGAGARAPDCDRVPSPRFISRDVSPRACSSYAGSSCAPSPHGGNSPRGDASPFFHGHTPRGDASPLPFCSSPRGAASPFCMPTRGDSNESLEEERPRLSLARDFRQGETIGAGSFGRVFSARHRGTGQIIAVKEMLIEGPNMEAEQSQDQSRLARELRLSEQLRHERVVRYFGHEYVPGGCGSSRRLYIFLEYCSGGSVASHLRTYGPLEEQLMAKYAQQLLEGLEYLHSLKPPVVHRDLKCANLLLTHDANVKIADFGCSKWLWEREACGEEGEHSMVGSVFWSAPEVLRGGGALTVAADFWSFGCCVLEMATAKHPWTEHQFDNVFQACRHIVYSEKLPEVSPDLPAGIKELVLACLRRSPAERPSAAALQALPLLAAAPLEEPA